MSALMILLIVLGVLILIVLVGGLIAIRRRDRSLGDAYVEHVAAADRALEEARAQDKGWDRGVLEETARRAVSERRPGWRYDALHLVLVDDRPGVAQDRAELVALGGGEEVRVTLARHDAGWVAEKVE